MRIHHYLRTLCACVVLAAACFGQSATVDLSGGLAHGQYSTGFRVLYKYDASRTWVAPDNTLAGSRKQPEVAALDAKGRPVRIEIWYPANGATGTAMKYGDYISLHAPKEFAQPEKTLEERDRLIASLSVPESKLGDLMATPVGARMDAVAAPGRFPLLIHFPGLNDAQALNEFVMAEFLASHGYVVVAVSLLGTSNQDTDQHRTAENIEATVRDAEYAWGLLRNDPMVDASKLAVSGHSLGAVEAMIFADRNLNAKAAIGLDGTYGFAGATDVLTRFYSYSPQKMTADVLDLRKNAGQQQTVFDLSAINDMHFSDRTLITIDQMHHSDFTSFAVVGYRLGMPSTYAPAAGEHFWSRETGYHGYLNVCQLILDYLDETLDHESGGEQRLRADLANAKSGTFELMRGAKIPPAARELVALGESKGFDAAAALVSEYQKQLPTDWVVNENTFNSLGYSLLGEKNPTAAIISFRLNTMAHPESSNVWDSLADGYIAAGATAQAISAYEQAIKAATIDKSLDEAGKKSFIADEQRKIAKLRQ